MELTKIVAVKAKAKLTVLKKDKSISICDKLPYFKSATNKDGVEHPPKVTLGGREMQIYIKRSSKDRLCTNNHCSYAHIFVLDKITKDVSTLNTWTLDIDGVKWSCRIIGIIVVIVVVLTRCSTCDIPSWNDILFQRFIVLGWTHNSRVS